MGTRVKGRFREKHPEHLVDRVSGVELEIDEKDLQIAAVAVQHGFLLATVDRNAKMQRIEDAAKALEQQGHGVILRIDDWGLPI